jgi:hypothetical protein
MDSAATNLTATLKTIASELATDTIRVREVQGKLYVWTRYTKASEWAANVQKVRMVAQTAQEKVGRETTREKASVTGFWNMGHFCKEGVQMCVRVKLTEEEDTAVLLGGNP